MLPVFCRSDLVGKGLCAGACVCACTSESLLIQHAKRMRRITLSSVASLAPPHFSTLSYKGRVSGK